MKEAKEFKVVECKGTPFEIGCQYGEACRDNIKKSLEINLHGLSLAYKASKEDIVGNAMKYLSKVQEFDPDLIEMLKGQAAGTGLSFEEVFTLRCMMELMIYYNQVISLCTSFAATGKATKDGKTILGQTIDWAPETTLDLLKIHHDNGLVQFALTIGGFVEYTLSSAGFGMCANATFGMDYSFNVPLGCYLPKVMRQQTIGSALEILKGVARGLGYYHLGSAEGEIVGIETVHDDFEVIRPEQDILIHTNHYITERFKQRDMANVVVPDSFTRLKKLRDLMDENRGDLTPQIMMDIFSDHENHPHSICSHVDLSRAPMLSATIASFIMVPEDKKMYIAYGNPCSVEYVE